MKTDQNFGCEGRVSWPNIENGHFGVQKPTRSVFSEIQSYCYIFPTSKKTDRKFDRESAKYGPKIRENVILLLRDQPHYSFQNLLVAYL